MSPRFSSIRTRITLLILVPLLALTSLWVLLTAMTYGDANELVQAKDFQQKTVLPTQRLMDGLQKERRLSMARLGDVRAVDIAEIRRQRQATDKAAGEVRAGAADQDLRGRLLPAVVARLDDLVAKLSSLDRLRRGVDDRAADRGDVLRGYSDIIDAGFAVYRATTPGDGTITARARTLTSFGRAREYLAREDALLTGALAAGRITPAERAEFAKLVGAHHTIHADNARDLHDEGRKRYEQLKTTPRFTQLMRMENEVIQGAALATAPQRTSKADGAQGTSAAQPSSTASQQSVPTGQGAARTSARDTAVIDPATWRASVDTVNAQLFDLENDVLADVTRHAHGIAIGTFTRLGLAGGLGLGAILLSFYIALRVSRRLVRECRALAGGVVSFTQDRLPGLAERIRSGRSADPEPDPEVDFRITEIRQIADSFDRAREAVVRAAEGEAAARRGISEVFVNLARRNQALLHRQLSLLDSMERRTEDPSELSDLFRLDHLATRMRRHAEGLVILAGKSAGRGWRRPVPLVDVVRGAVAEVEDYPRVRVQPLPRVALLGSAVADVIHLLAEIVENATTFSPPQSPVWVSGHAVANGFAIEVEDRGLGMTEEALRAANARLADPPEFDPSDSAQLGLFVVARLAERHGIQVTLRPSPYGGTTAIVLLPGSLIVENPEPESTPRRATGPLQALPGTAPALSASAVPAAGGRTDPGGLVRLLDAEPASVEAAPPSGSPQASGESGATQTRPEPAEAKTESDARPQPPSAPAPGELPRRRRQQHLAPELKERVDAYLAAEGRLPPDAGPSAGRPPEPAAAPLSAPVPGDGPAGPAPGDAATGDAVTDDAAAGDAETRDEEAGSGTVPEGGTRSPEAMRSMMSAMQRGWQRGRQEAADAEAARNAAHQEDDTP